MSVKVVQGQSMKVFCKIIFLLLTLLYSCQSDNGKYTNFPAASKSLETAYQQLLNECGDTVLTGVEIQAVGKKRAMHEMMDLQVRSTGNPIIIPAHPNVYNADELKTELPPESVKIKTFTTGSILNPRPIINSVGDTIPTGIPIPAIGKRVPVRWPKPLVAFSPRYMDNATVDLKFLGVEQGLRSNSVVSIIQDSRGNLWFGTNGGGVTLYDGTYFWNFTEESGLTENSVYTLFEDSKGRIWIGTQKGLIYFDGADFVQFNESDRYCNNATNNIVEDRDGNIWLGSYDHGSLCKYDGETFTYYAEREGFKAEHIQSMIADQNGAIWISAIEDGLYKFEDSVFTQFNFFGVADKAFSITSIHKDALGNLWLGTWTGLLGYHEGRLSVYAKEGLIQIISAIVQDHQGNIWFGGGEGLMKYDGQNFTHISTVEGISNKLVYDIQIIDSGIIWIATSGGVNMYDPNSFQHPKVLSNMAVRSIFQDSNGGIWFGTREDGVLRYDGQNYYQFTEDQGFFDASSTIWAIEEDQNGNIWFGADRGSGLIKYDGLRKARNSGTNSQGTFTHYTPKHRAAATRMVSNIIQDNNNRLWISYEAGGLLCFDGKTACEFTAKDGLISDNILPRMIKDQQGNLWVFTSHGGVTRIDPGIQTDESISLIHFSEKEGLTNKVFHSILPDSFGKIWLADKSGIVYTYLDNVGSSDSKMFSHLNLDGMRNRRQIESMIRDTKGYLWLSSHSGLDRVVLDSATPTETAVSSSWYGKQDGLKALNFYRPVLLDNYNHIWWSGDKGIMQLNVDQYKISDQAPKLHLSEIEINDRHIDFRNAMDALIQDIEFDTVQPFGNIPIDLQLSHHLNSITFHVNALDWEAPHQIRYSYMLEGVNKEWTIPDAATFANFQRLPHGNYTFKVRAYGLNKQWSDTLSYSFVIYPPWWLTWWAIVLYVFISVFGIAGMIRLRTHNLKLRSKELEQTVHERTAALEKTIKELKEAQAQLVQSEKMASLGLLTAGIAHEINNPVNFGQTSTFALEKDIGEITELINRYRDYAQGGDTDRASIQDFEKQINYNTLVDSVKRQIHNIKEGIRRTAEIVSSLREFSYASRGEMEPADIHRGIDTTLKLLNSRFNEQIVLTKNYDQSVGLIKCHLAQLNQVIMNLLTNALDAIGDKGEIVITTKTEGERFKISVRDSGIGIPEANLDKIFDPFFTTKKVGRGTGLGLTISHKIIKDHGGYISVKSNEMEGTVFTISLPYVH